MSLQAVFYPEAIAIVGASTKPNTVGNDVVKNLATQGYAGKIYPVNPKAEELYGLKCYPDMNAIEGKIDLVVIAIPAVAVPEAIAQAAAKGAKGAIVISAGFKEVGNVELEQALRAECDKHGISLIGPNCLGVINSEIKMNASFASLMPQSGPVAFFSQSGALCTAVLDYAEKLGIGFSKFVSMGNKAQVDEIKLFEYIYSDPQTKVVIMYVEDLKEGLKFREAALKLTRGETPKPILILKSGRTAAGASASASHTGSLAGNDAAYDALFRQSGIIRAESVSQLFDLTQNFINNPLPTGHRVAIITNAGGPGVLATDAAILNGLTLAKLDEATKTALKEFLPPAASSANPVDVLGDAKADRYAFALEHVAKDENVDSIVIILTPQSMTEIDATAEAVIAARTATKKPIVTCFMGEQTVNSGIKMLRAHGFSAINFPEEGVKTMAVLTDFADFQNSPVSECKEYTDVDKKLVTEMFAEAKAKGVSAFPEAEAVKVLAAYGFPVLKSFVAKTREEAESYAQKIGQKMVLKIVSKDILHKSDAGGVVLNVLPEKAGEAYDQVLKNCKAYKADAEIDGVLLVEMVDLKQGLEFILGANKDATLGQMIMVGLGGIYVEVFKDVAFALAPLSVDEAKATISRIKSSQLLRGARGQTPLDEEKLLECLGRLSQLLIDFPEIKELDINPLLILPQGQGVKALDARIIIE